MPASRGKIKCNVWICSFTGLVAGPISEAGDTLGGTTPISCSLGLRLMWEEGPSRWMMICVERQRWEKQRGPRLQREEEAALDRAAG